MKLDPLHIKIGKLGEEIASRYLIDNGYRIESRNYRAKGGEIDVIAVKNNTFHFVEVKTVSCENFNDASGSGFRPEDNVHDWKIQRLKLVITLYLSKINRGLDSAWEFDIITIRLNQKTKEAQVNFLKDIIL